MNSLKSGWTAGFVATVVLSILMIAKSMMGLMPDMNPIKDIVFVVARFTGVELPLPFGWVGHFVIGSLVWGTVYALIQSRLPGPALVKGLVFGVLAWLAMMIVFMPLAGQGFFAMKLGATAMVATLVLHLVYGAVLGFMYPRMSGSAAAYDVKPA